MKPVRFGVIGVGGMGAGHVRALMEMEEAELIAGADIVAEARDKFTAAHGLECYESYHDLLARPEIEAVCIVTPHPLHRPMAVDALKAKKHVLCEKPIAGTVYDADAMIEAGDKTGMKLGVVFQQRTRPDVQEAAKLVHSGQLGELLRATLVAPSFRTQAYYDHGSKWRGTWQGEQGGVLLNQAPHPLDLFCWLAGMPVRVHGFTSTRLHRIETEDSASALLEYANGAHGLLHVNTTEVPSETTIEIAFTRGKLVVRDNEVRVATPSVPIDEFMLTTPEMWGKIDVKWRELNKEGPQGHSETIRDFALAVREKRDPLVTGEQGRESLELANAIVLSSEQRRAVTLPIDREAYAALIAAKVRA